MLNSRIYPSLILGIIGLSYISFITFSRVDAIYLFKLNIIIPMVIITFSLSFITHGIRGAFRAFQNSIKYILSYSDSINKRHVQCLRDLSKSSYISGSLWILYSGIHVFSDQNYSVDAFISFSFAAILYAFIFSEIVIRTLLIKISVKKNEYED
ncbi:MAG: hypothetical protein BM565_01800 [Gammaproteobacteria bacterium MedPE]|nr:MAG: hypothetical protein BM565_01800 [Gammaproteobacteria bacterium MedPE]